MDFISTALVTISQPTGFWETILNAFKSATGTYIMAVILLALIVRILFSLVDIINKKVNMKNMDINAKMRPELEAIQKRYGHDQRLLQQKTNEIYKKYQFSMMSSCLPMLLTMILQFTVFLTLWNSLQAVSNYNIVNQYENMKNLYANVIVLNEEEGLKSKLYDLAGQDYQLDAEIDFENNKLKITINQTDVAPQVFEFNYVNTWTNQDIFELLQKYVNVPQEETPTDPETPSETTAFADEGGEETPTPPEIEYVDTGFNELFKTLAEQTVEDYYVDTQEGFLWIKNIYKAESPTSPLFTKSEITNYLSKYYTDEEKATEEANDYEGQIFDYVVAGIDTKALGVNGYYILTIIAVVTSFLSLWLSNKLMKNKKNPVSPQNPGGIGAAANSSAGGSKLMYFIMPVIIGIFTFMYTSLFAIYLIVGQLVMMLLTPLTTWIVRKWLEAESKKQKEKDVIEVDYRRKDK